ncbi:probable chlorophyll(ide) b reductase NYC1, chloroplastic [Dendrobium catenatum]|uniref:chlorophyll(ide) b reductase n=1 Tax=Dendrobium catenatum TaxID=906689 RepID=A0A2I0WUF0_9ASPA|nr:probable chlorophyll(ide) b reductase NYC1, chloroplastic [Dendrobium catenatum]PKU79290.1 putative chlorophyll(ide) b reductase NYC1, chloroplastic [Dendrobium catenatum]
MAAVVNLSVTSLEYVGGISLPRVDQCRRLRHLGAIEGVASSLCSLRVRRKRIGLLPCKAFGSEDGRGSSTGDGDGNTGGVEEKSYVFSSKAKRKGPLYSLKSLLVRISGVKSPPEGPYRKIVEKAEDIFFSVSTQVGRYLLTMMSTGVILAIGFQLSGGDAEMNALIWYSWLGGIIIGTMIGANIVLEEYCKAGPRNVVITGSTRGLGKALAREFLLSGDRVVVASRSPESVQSTVEELNENLKEGMSIAGSKRSVKLSSAKVVGIPCDVCKPDEVRDLANFAVKELGSVDIWINNAGTNKGFRPLLQFTDEDIDQIVSANLVGSLICTREAIRVMGAQGKGGHVFNMDGAGSGGSSTPLTAVYGSTKCGLRQLRNSLMKECRRSKVGIHTASPGMVLTDLLLSGSSLRNKQMFNIICELPETVARSLVPRIRVVKGSGKAINYLTPPRILVALVTAWLRRGRWFDDQGRALYAAEADRIRNWAENRARFSFTDAMEMYTENAWVSVFSLSVVCAFIILSSSTNSVHGT